MLRTLYNEEHGNDRRIVKRNVTKIIYEDGDVDIVTSDIRDRRRSATQDESTTIPKMNEGKNIVSVIAGYTLSPFDQSINDGGLGIAYERSLDRQGHLSISIPVMIFFSSDMDYDHAGVIYSGVNNRTNVNGAASFYIMPGLKFYPMADNRVVRYSFGASLLCVLGNEPLAVYQDGAYYGNGQTAPTSGTRAYNLVGLMITNSVNITSSAHINIALDLGIGIPFSDDRFIRSANLLGPIPNPILQFSLKIGYRY